jgi:DNA ligase (NAD+)
VATLELTDFLAAVGLATEAADAYYNGGLPMMTDDQYDDLVETIFESVSENPEWRDLDGVANLLEEVAAGVSVQGDVAHSVPMLSLSKTKDSDDLRAFIATMKTDVILEPKVDGIAAIVRYVDGVRTLIATRGSGESGENITSRIDALRVNGLPKTLNRPLTFEVRGELYMSPEDMKFSNASRVAAGGESFANPRNATSGTVMRETVRYEAQVSFAGYEVFGDDSREVAFSDDSYSKRMNVLSDLGIGRAADLFPESVKDVLSTQGIVAGAQALGEARAAGLLAAATDGCVVKVDSTLTRTTLGASSRHPRWALAFKYPAMRVQTTMNGILRTVGRTGNIAYTAMLTPILVDGSTVERATLHNSKFITDKDLRINDTVILHKAGDIIPRVDEPVLALRPENSVPYAAPTTCPQCGEELDRSGVIWRCETPSCGIVSLLDYALSTDCLDVDGFSIAVATALVDAGTVENLSDIFHLTVDSLASLKMGVTKSGANRVLGMKNAQKIIDGIEKAKSQPLSRVVCALGIRKTGRTMSRRIAATFGSMDAILAASESDFLRVEGVSGIKASHIYAGIQRMRDDIDRMTAAGVNMLDASKQNGSEPADAAPQVLDGKKVVVTGSMAGSPLEGLNRLAVQELIEKFGGQASGSVSTSTSILVYGEENSSKHKKALSLREKGQDIEILTPTDFAELLGI